MLSILELQLLALKKSILELQLEALQKAQKKKNNRMVSNQSHCGETGSRSRQKTRKTKSKTAKIKEKIASLQEQKDTTISSIATHQKSNQLQAEQVTISFLNQHQYTHQQFLEECAKLVQANTVLTQLIRQAATQKYQLQERIVTKMRHIEELERRLSMQKQGENTE